MVRASLLQLEGIYEVPSDPEKVDQFAVDFLQKLLFQNCPKRVVKGLSALEFVDALRELAQKADTKNVSETIGEEYCPSKSARALLWHFMSMSTRGRATVFWWQRQGEKGDGK